MIITPGIPPTGLDASIGSAANLPSLDSAFNNPVLNQDSANMDSSDGLRRDATYLHHTEDVVNAVDNAIAPANGEADLSYITVASTAPNMEEITNRTDASAGNNKTSNATATATDTITAPDINGMLKYLLTHFSSGGAFAAHDIVNVTEPAILKAPTPNANGDNVTTEPSGNY